MGNLLKQVYYNKGATIKNAHIVNYKTGYQAAINSQEKTFDNLASLLYHASKQQLKSFGVWLDNGKWYIDTNSIRISTKKEALYLAKENSQIAIWDWKKNKTVYVN